MNRLDEVVVGTLASFIGARLQYPCPRINGQGNPWVSTINVDQDKEKFGYVRVYCTLADPDQVKRKWEWMKDREQRRAAGEQFYSRVTQDVIDTLSADEPTSEFTMRCLKSDAIHYRRVYLEAVELRPGLRSKICDQADYGELLFEDLNAALKALDVARKVSCHYKFDSTTFREFLRQVYEPTSRDLRDLRD